MAKLNINLVPTQMIATELIDNNTGQIAGVKANPRVLRDDKFRKLKKSIQDNPKMMALRERNPETGEVVQSMTAYHQKIQNYDLWPRVVGYQLRYIYFIDPKWRKRLTVPEIPFSKIDEMGAGMYKGENVTRESRHEIKGEAQIEREANKNTSK